MAIGSNIPNYLAMANQADAAGLQQTKGMIGAAQQGINIGSRLHDRFQEQAAQEAFQKAWMSNDPNAMQQVIAQFPKFGQQMLKMIGIRDDQHRQAVGSMGIRVAGLLENGDVQGAQDVIRQNANLFDPTGEGSADSIINDIGKGAADPKKLEQWKNRMQKLTLSTLSPREIMDWGTQQRGMDLRQQGLEQQLQLGEERIQAMLRGQDMLNNRSMMMLNRPGVGEREWNFFNSLSPDDQQRYLQMKNKGGSSGVFQGLQTVQLANGQTAQIDPKVHGSGANAFYQGTDSNGKLIDIPVSSVVTPISPSEQAGQTLLSGDLSTLLTASDDDLQHITGSLRGGGTGKMPLGADTYTGYTGGTAREIFNAANRIQGNMQNKGIEAAKSMGASGINTISEAKLYFQSMPQLDYSSPKALKQSVNKIQEYTAKFNQQHNVNLSGSGKKTVSQMSDSDLLKGL